VTALPDTLTLPATLPTGIRTHLENVAANLQLVADLCYGDAALALADEHGRLAVIADARPSTAVAPFSATRVGAALNPLHEPEAYAAVADGRCVAEGRRRVINRMAYLTTAFPIGSPAPYAAVIRTYAEQVEMTAGRMERAFIECAHDLLKALRLGPLLDIRDGEPFAVTRRAGDGVLRVSPKGRVAYASPNAVTIMRLAGVEGRVTGMNAAELPGGGFAISPVVGTSGAFARQAEVAGRALGFRSIATPAGVLVLVEDLTEARRREREIELKEATIREVHHRVKNNLQTIASLLRLQARRSDSDEVRRALMEATERAASMAAVHDLLARSENERIDFAAVARTVVDLVRRGLMGDDPGIVVEVAGATGDVDAIPATSLALALAELVHNALEHAFAPETGGLVQVVLERTDRELVLTVRDNGCGLAPGFDPRRSTSMGFSIVRTLVEEDLRGTLNTTSDNGTVVSLRIPLPDAADPGGRGW
jgi:two-component sensor histidine kinase